jgi:hypothetical protein
MKTDSGKNGVVPDDIKELVSNSGEDLSKDCSEDNPEA